MRNEAKANSQLQVREAVRITSVEMKGGKSFLGKRRASWLD